ncbi:MAG: 6-phosphogluconolactonase [Armatimonadota bacterium]
MRTIHNTVKIAHGRDEMGKEAAADIATAMHALADEPAITMCFAAAPSQDDMLQALVQMPDLPWEKVIAFHLDEYIDLPRGHANTFEVYLNDHLFNHVPVGQVNFMADMDGSPEEQAQAYDDLLRDHGGIDIACIGIGENGHIAFNEPGSEFQTDRWCDLITIDEKSVRQQYRDYKDHPNPQARYASLEDVPRNAITMTVPAICASRQIFCVVPAEQKAEAVKGTLEGPVTEEVPATALRTHPAATFYLDGDSAKLLTPRVGA